MLFLSQFLSPISHGVAYVQALAFLSSSLGSVVYNNLYNLRRVSWFCALLLLIARFHTGTVVFQLMAALYCR